MTLPLPPAATEITSEDPGTRARPLAVMIVALIALAVGLAPIPGLPIAAHRTLVVLTVAAGLWLSEALPVAITALLVPVLGVTLGVTDAKGAFAGFGDPIVFLFFGTFLLTDAAEQHGLNARLARGVLGLKWVGGHPTRLLWSVAILGCLISAWVNNTATTVMLLPLALTAERAGSRRLLVATLLMAAYAPSLGGLATPVGTAPNLIGLRLLEQATGARPSFAEWCVRFAPLAILGTLMTTVWLSFVAGREAGRPGAGSANGASERAAAPSAGRAASTTSSAATAAPARRWSRAERTLIPVYFAVLLLWIAPGILAGTPLAGAAWLKAWQARVPETVAPMLGALALFLLPSGAARGARILEVKVLKRVDWSTLLLFGGGLSLGAMMFESGLARAIGEAIFRSMPIHGTFGVVLSATLMAVVVSEMTSNTASAALVVPVVLALAQAAGMDPARPALAATVACSFGFMLPVSTPPNALVYATGRVRMREMILYGIVLDIFGVMLVSTWMTWVG
ncbi:MAG: SLC13 family permease [Candidatus Eisenbacteria bacterium]